MKKRKKENEVMKKRFQKYLSGSNEGFSLVELIIVIAIMAILIGVVALAVIPYLEKSRESKDLQALDTICNALTTAVADTKVTGTGSFSIDASGSVNATGSESKVWNAMSQTLGEATLTLSSQYGAGQPIVCCYDTANNKVVCYVKQHDTASGGVSNSFSLGSTTITVQNCQYNDNAPLMVSN